MVDGEAATAGPEVAGADRDGGVRPPRGREPRFSGARGDRRRRRPGRLLRLGVAAALLAVAACGADGSGAGGEGDAASGTAVPEARQEAGADSGADAGRGSSLTTLRVAGIPVRAEIADEEAERERGLMNRDSLGADEGMLFVYPEQRTLSFWMRNTRIPLSIAFIDRRGVIVDIQQMDPHTEELHRSRQPAMYALEMNRGWFREHGVAEGDRIRF